MTLQEPRPGLADESAYFVAYLDFYRETSIAKCASITVAELRSSRLPSGWTPLELLHHLAAVERRWFVWGFLGEQVAEPWGDSLATDRDKWYVAPERTLDDVTAQLRAQGERTNEVIRGHRLDGVASTAGRFAESEPPTLSWICFHVLQEYARHAGHLDIVVELAGGHVGE